jgi:hypothetical protein
MKGVWKMKNLKPEQVFVGNDSGKYVYLHKDREKIVFSDYDNEEGIYSEKPSFVADVKKETRDRTRGRFAFITTFESLNSMSDYEIVYYLLSRQKGCFLESKKRMSNKSDTMEITKIGDKLLVGEAYYHETNEYYKVIGLEMEVCTKYHFDEKPHVVKEVGFYSVYLGKHSPTAPYDFVEGRDFGSSRYTNGFGDHVEITDTYRKLDLPEIDLSKWNV